MLIAGGAVFELFGDLAEVGDVVFGGHGDAALPEFGEGGVAVKDGAVLGVDVGEVEVAGAGGELVFDRAEELAEEWSFEGVEEKGEGGGFGVGEGEGVGLEEADGGEELRGSGIAGEGGGDVVSGDGGKARVELDAENLEEGDTGRRG